MFYFATLLFALFIYLIGSSNPKCMHVNGLDFGDPGTSSPFGDAFALSWTTFSTVGYGLVFPATSTTIGSEQKMAKECPFTMILVTLEAFIGILFAAIFGAIFFAKVTRAASFAQVSFSDAMIIKYGTAGIHTGGINHDDELSTDDDDEILDSAISYKKSRLPCPILEFRIANRLSRQRGGEIIDASINIVASIDERHAAQNLRSKARGTGTTQRRRGKKGNKRRRRANKSRRGLKNIDDEGGMENSEMNIKKAQDAVMDMVTKEASMMEGELTGKLSDKIVFARLHVESNEHPFLSEFGMYVMFWTIRHLC
jgi:hypothetical protein